MRLIDALELKRSIACSSILEDGKTLEQIIDEQPTIEPEQRWIPFIKRPLTDEEKEMYPDWCYILENPLPHDGQEILISRGDMVWKDEFYNDGECGLDGGDDIEDGMAWMPLPEPWKGEHP